VHGRMAICGVEYASAHVFEGIGAVNLGKVTSDKWPVTSEDGEIADEEAADAVEEAVSAVVDRRYRVEH
jgi:hypothetical protein